MDENEWFENHSDIIMGCYTEEDECIWFEYENIPEETLSAYTETGQAESSILVPNQRSYSGGNLVIPSSVANVPCTALGVSGMLEKLNATLGTSYTLFTPWIYSLLGNFITNGSNFGIAYAYLRPIWYDDLADVEDKLRTRKELDRKMQEDVFVNNKTISDWVPPRRVWDLYSNRVVPWWIARKWKSPISHACMDEKDRENVMTPINGYEWPVPIPKDTNLDLIHIEMLNLGAEYTWLDVLCLRQVNKEWKEKEDLRKEEWKVDVPTIGWVYKEGGCRGGRAIYYLNGLGRPLNLKAGDFGSERSWFRRAWTLQEICHNPIIGGVTNDVDALDANAKAMLEDRLSSLETIWDGHVFMALSEMQRRVSTNHMDKVAGLGYLLGLSYGIPAYCETQSEEDAWTSLMDVMYDGTLGKIFFLYPRPGNGNDRWRPTWRQVMQEVLPSHCPRRGIIGWVQRTKKTANNWYYRGPYIESGYVSGLGLPEGKRRQGELVIDDTTGTRHLFKIVADHQYPILDGSYTLVGSILPDPHDQIQDQYWVVGERLPEQMFKKVSVFRMRDLEEVKRLGKLGIAIAKKIYLA